ncbi:MAG: 3-phosphoshikimate 1-carboxyvinyltransferase [Acutalibacteraceae bacterium]
MEKLLLSPCKLNGTVTVPPSKSDGHRAIICAALSKGKSKISNISYSNDINATLSCIESLGAKVTRFEKEVIIESENLFKNKKATLNCQESGSTLRFFIPVSVIEKGEITFLGSGELPNRPIGVYTDILPQKGVSCTKSEGEIISLYGSLKSGRYEVPGNISSQFITGLLLALPMLSGDSEIVVTTALESVAYIDMTIECMEKFGVHIEKTKSGYFIKGNQKYIPQEYTVCGDWSQAAFFMCAGAIQNKVTVKGVDNSSTQGDREICKILSSFGADVKTEGDSVTVFHKELKGTEIDAMQIPDLVPILTVVASLAKGTTIIKNAQRLRIKECDRLKAISEAINTLGGNVTQTDDGLIINGVENFKGGNIDGYNDHRIVMSASIASIKTENKIEVSYPYSINKSYPDFYMDFNSLGGEANVIHIR